MLVIVLLAWTPRPPEPPLEFLLKECLSGDAPSIRQFVLRVVPLLRRRALRVFFGPRGRYGKLVAEHEVDDIVQTMLEVLFRNDAHTLRAFQPERGPLEPYLGMIARREAGNYLDHKLSGAAGGGVSHVPMDQEEEPFELATGEGDPEAEIEARERGRKLEAELLAQLSDQGRLYYRLLFVEELETEEVVRLRQVSRDVVFSWRKRIRDMVAEILETMEQT